MGECNENKNRTPLASADPTTDERTLLLHNKNYESFKIPDRKSNEAEGAVKPSQNPKGEAIPSLPDGMFYELEYGCSPVCGVGKFVLKTKPQKIEEREKDEIRELFDRMREIARAIRESDRLAHRSTYDYSRFFDRRVQNDSAVIFYQQGLFMKDFTDDYTGNTQFSKYFPYYQMMGYEQLRTYFTWRTGVRQGNVADTSLSYAFLYIYELLSHIGADDAQDGLYKLMFFWKAFRVHDKSIDKYVPRWLKDYHVYYSLPHSFKEFIQKNDLAEYYPDFEKTGDSFDLFCSISKYNIKKSVFFTDTTRKMISDCFSFVLDSVRESFLSAGINFDDSLFRPTRKLTVWKPFKDALFHSPVKHKDGQFVLSENEIYLCKNNEWKFSTVITTEKGRQFIGYIMKQTEAVLRSVTKYRFKLTAKTDMIHIDTIRILTKSGLDIEKIVTDAVTAYHREATKTIVAVNQASLARIRQEAFATQEALIVEEELQQNVKTAAATPFSSHNQNIFGDTFEAKPVSDRSGWENLRDALDEDELKALEVILHGDSIKAFADKRGIMTEVLVDSINEKSMDFIGDNLMDEDFILYDDYRNNAEVLIK